MKPIRYLSIVTFFLLSSVLYGQKYSVGISSGATFFTQKAEMEDRYIGEPLYKTGLNIQSDFMLHLNENIGLKLGVAYEQRGFYREQIFSFGEGAYTFDFHYLSFPLTTELSFGQKIKIKAHAGLSVEHLLKHIHLRPEESLLPIRSDRTRFYKRTYWSALAGIGAEFPISKRLSLELGGRCSVGLTTLQKTNSWVMFKYFGFVTSAGVRYAFGNS